MYAPPRRDHCKRCPATSYLQRIENPRRTCMKKQAVNSTDSDEARSGAVPPRLPSRHEGRLTSYAMAAGAAAVGLLALVPPAKAAIIYTPSHISILYDGTYQGGGFVTYALDINRDGVPDFSFQL